MDDDPDVPSRSGSEPAAGPRDADGDRTGPAPERDPDGDPTAVARELYDLPFHRHRGIEVLEVTAETARTRWPFETSMVGNPEVPALHGGVVSALADLTGAAVFVGNLGRYTPTIDLRVDYLRHAERAELTAEAEVVRRGGSVGVADVLVRTEGERCASATGVYKLSGGD